MGVISHLERAHEMKIPHLRVITSFCIAAIVGYALFSTWAVFYSNDQTLLGDVGGTWKSFAVGAFGFWIGSSSGGKSREPVGEGGGNA